MHRKHLELEWEMLLIFASNAIIAIEGVVNRRGRSKTEGIEEEEEEKGERIPAMLEEDQICEAEGCRFRAQTTS